MTFNERIRSILNCMNLLIGVEWYDFWLGESIESRRGAISSVINSISPLGVRREVFSDKSEFSFVPFALSLHLYGSTQQKNFVVNCVVEHFFLLLNDLQFTVVNILPLLVRSFSLCRWVSVKKGGRKANVWIEQHCTVLSEVRQGFFSRGRTATLLCSESEWGLHFHWLYSSSSS